MNTECNGKLFEFEPLDRREVVAQFNGGTITSDAGALLLREVEAKTGILSRFARGFRDHRDPDLIEHTVLELVAQRVMALALGYEDLNDHDDLRRDPLMSLAAGKADPTGQDRRRERDRGKALAGKSTLNRLELTRAEATQEERYKKIVANDEQMRRAFVDVFLDAHSSPPKEIILDLDATDDPVYGNQELKFFHGYYREYCYLPLYVFCGDELLLARLRRADKNPVEDVVADVERIVAQIRTRWPEVKIILRGDSEFAREALMSWSEGNGVDYVFGLAKNSRLIDALSGELAEAKQAYQTSGKASRVFKDFTYRTLESWSRERRVVGKAEHLDKGANPRFVVTSLTAQSYEARELYEDLYCARGEMENRIKEQQQCLFADRTSAATFRGNQIRLWFSSMAYVLMQALRRLGLAGTQLARAQCDTIRLKLLKIGALVKITIRRVCVSLAEGCPYENLFAQVHERLRGLARMRHVTASGP